MSIKRTGILVNKAKEAVLNSSIIKDWVTIKEWYECSITVLDNLEEGRYSIASIHEDLCDINFKYILGIKSYIINRIFTTIM